MRKKLKEKMQTYCGKQCKKEGAGFGSDTNIVTIFKKNKEKIELPVLTKKEVAYEIFKEVYKSIKKEV